MRVNIYMYIHVYVYRFNRYPNPPRLLPLQGVVRGNAAGWKRGGSGSEKMEKSSLLLDVDVLVT